MLGERAKKPGSALSPRERVAGRAGGLAYACYTATETSRPARTGAVHVARKEGSGGLGEKATRGATVCGHKGAVARLWREEETGASGAAVTVTRRYA